MPDVRMSAYNSSSVYVCVSMDEMPSILPNASSTAASGANAAPSQSPNLSAETLTHTLKS